MILGYILSFLVGAVVAAGGIVVGYFILTAKEMVKPVINNITEDTEEGKAISSLQEQLNNLLRYDGTSKGQKEVSKFE